MLKKLLKPVRELLLKFECVRSLVACSLKRLEKERQAKHRATLMLSGRRVRNVIPEKKGALRHSLGQRQRRPDRRVF